VIPFYRPGSVSAAVVLEVTARRRWLWLFRGVAPRPTKAARASIWLRQTDRAERWDCREDGSISRPSQGAESRDSPKRSLKRIDLGPSAALDYSGSAGLLWAINGGRLVELHRNWAVIDVPLHRSQRIFSRRNVDAAKITLPRAEETTSRQPAALGRQGPRKAGRPPRP
jgi:hypothetical protein